MPYKYEYVEPRKFIARKDDKRVKLTEDQKKDIKKLYGKISQRKLAKMYGVSRRLIVFIGCPEKHRKNLENRACRGGSRIYYDREKHNLAIKKHRKYKQKLYKNNMLVEKNGKI